MNRGEQLALSRIGVLTSGGDAPGMNAAIRAVARRAIYDGVEVVGVRHGFQGLISGDFQPLDLGSVGDIIHRGGTILLTARSSAFLTEEGQRLAVDALAQAGIEGLIVVGGDGSLRGAQALARRGVVTIGIPASIDNDLPFTQWSIGFDTAVNTALDAIDRIRDTATSHERTFVIEVMGHSCGWIALAAGLGGGAESILLPEEPFSLDAIIERLDRGRARGKRHSIIVVSEGTASATDVAQAVTSRTGMETRVTILGHVQRGGSPTAVDRLLASQMGARAVELLEAGAASRAIGVREGHLVDDDIEEALKKPRQFPHQLAALAAILSI